MPLNPVKVLALAAFAAIALAGCFGPGTHPTSGPGGVPPGLYHLFEYNNCSVTASGSSPHNVGTPGFAGSADYGYAGPLYFQVRPDDTSVDNEGCLLRLADSVWDKKFPPDINDGFGNGMYRVGVEVPPGTYKTGGSLAGFCGWSRLSNFNNDASSVLQSGHVWNYEGSINTNTVTIQPTDVGFGSSGCLAWTKIG
jgi:hypothetical protein